MAHQFYRVRDICNSQFAGMIGELQAGSLNNTYILLFKNGQKGAFSERELIPVDKDTALGTVYEPPIIELDTEKKRPEFREYWLSIAKTVSSRSTCKRCQYGSVIVRDDKIISTGYNGACSGSVSCLELPACPRVVKNVKPGERYELCRSVHSEQNAIIQADPVRMQGASLYLYGEENGSPIRHPFPCLMCQRVIINAGILEVITPETDINVVEWFFDGKNESI